MSSLINISKLKIGYSNGTKENLLIDDLNASVKEGEVIALLGLNGSGKTTLIKHLLAELKPLEGDILYSQKNLKDYSSQDLAKQVASVKTRYQNPGNISVWELVGFGRYPFTSRLHLLKENDRKLINAALSKVGIVHLKERMVEELSDGERQKVMLACAIAQATPILILDEPTSHLDVRNKVAMMNLIKSFSKEDHKTILFSTHDLGLARNVATRIWLIHDQKLIDESATHFMDNKSWKPLLEGIDEALINWL